MSIPDTIEIPALFSNKIAKKITFNNDGIKIQKSLSFYPNVFIPSENIISFRYGVKFMQGYAFTIGRCYIIETKDAQNKISRIKLYSFYGIKRNSYYNIWSSLISKLWENYFVNIYNYYIELYTIKQIFEIAGVTFHEDGISWRKKHKLLWREIALNNYATYFMIRHVDDPKNHKSCSFRNDWNALLLQSLLKGIIQQQKIISN
jgi:hypothetical protein